jgi:hypothetical protein
MMWRRVIPLITCALVIAWLGLGLRSVALQRSAGVASPSAISATEVSKRLHELRDAQFLIPSSAPLREQVELLVFTGRTRAALAAAERLVHREPAAFESWLLLFRVANGVDPGRAAVARREALKLNPLAALGRKR